MMTVETSRPRHNAAARATRRPPQIGPRTRAGYRGSGLTEALPDAQLPITTCPAAAATLLIERTGHAIPLHVDAAAGRRPRHPARGVSGPREAGGRRSRISRFPARGRGERAARGPA